MVKYKKVHIYSEKQFQQVVVDLARDLGWMVYHTYNSRRSEPGFPDLTMVRRGRVIFAELKTEEGKLAPEQDVWLTSLAECEDIEVYVWRPSEWEDIQEVLLSERAPTRLETVLKEIG